MPRHRRVARDPLLIEVLTALGAGPVSSVYLIDDEHPDDVDLLGICSDRAIAINEAAHIVRTLIHELIHRVRPQWSERSVNRRTTQIMRAISHAEIERIYQVYEARKHKVKAARRC
jgi:hypothetical protein